jgi:hypothetical protein
MSFEGGAKFVAERPGARRSNPAMNAVHALAKEAHAWLPQRRYLEAGASSIRQLRFCRP